jgi:hypothetical protein
VFCCKALAKQPLSRRYSNDLLRLRITNRTNTRTPLSIKIPFEVCAFLVRPLFATESKAVNSADVPVDVYA